MSDFIIFRKTRYCPGATQLGEERCTVEVGDLIQYRVAGRSQLARVLGLAKGKLPDGSDAGNDTLVVLTMGDFFNHAYVRYVKLDEVLRIRRPSDSGFAQWFLRGPMPRPEVALAASRYGVLNDRHFDRYTRDGELRADFREVDRVK